MKKHISHYCIIPAAGIGARLQQNLPKQYIKIHGKTILEHTLHTALTHPDIKKVILVLHPEDTVWPSLLLPYAEKIQTAQGGAKRADSVLSGLLALQAYAKPEDWVIIHDGARPCWSHDDIDRLIAALADHPTGGLTGIPINDTLKHVLHDNSVNKTIDREQLWCAQTPQMFRFSKLLHAYQKTVSTQDKITDSASALEWVGEKPVMVMGRVSNIKITFPEDLKLATSLLK